MRFTIIYRDAGNFKAYCSITLANPDALKLEGVELRFCNACDSRKFLIAHQIHLPELFLEIDRYIRSNDHCIHQFDYLEYTEAESNDARKRTIQALRDEAEREAKLTGSSSRFCYSGITCPPQFGLLRAKLGLLSLSPTVYFSGIILASWRPFLRLQSALSVSNEVSLRPVSNACGL